jgi:hypothetical protein
MMPRIGAVRLAEDSQRDVAGERQAGDEDDHPPGLVGIEGAVRAHVAVRQDRQDDQRQRAELQHRHEVLARHLLRQGLQFGLEVEQGGGDDAEHAGDDLVAEPDERAVGAAQQCGDRRRRAGILVLDVGGDHDGADDDDAGGGDPGRAEALRQHRADRAEQRDQREGAQARRRVRRALAFEAHQQADAEADRERLQCFETLAAHRRSLARAVPSSPAAAAHVPQCSLTLPRRRRQGCGDRRRRRSR